MTATFPLPSTGLDATAFRPRNGPWSWTPADPLAAFREPLPAADR